MKKPAEYYIGDMDYQERKLNKLLMWSPETVRAQAQRMMRKRLYKHFGLLNKYNGDGSLKYAK